MPGDTSEERAMAVHDGGARCELHITPHIGNTQGRDKPVRQPRIEKGMMPASKHIIMFRKGRIYTINYIDLRQVIATVFGHARAVATTFGAHADSQHGIRQSYCRHISNSVASAACYGRRGTFSRSGHWSMALRLLAYHWCAAEKCAHGRHSVRA